MKCVHNAKNICYVLPSSSEDDSVFCDIFLESPDLPRLNENTSFDPLRIAFACGTAAGNWHRSK